MLSRQSNQDFVSKPAQVVVRVLRLAIHPFNGSYAKEAVCLFAEFENSNLRTTIVSLIAVSAEVSASPSSAMRNLQTSASACSVFVVGLAISFHCVCLNLMLIIGFRERAEGDADNVLH